MIYLLLMRLCIVSGSEEIGQQLLSQLNPAVNTKSIVGVFRWKVITLHSLFFLLHTSLRRQP